MLAHLVAPTGLLVQTRLDPQVCVEDSRTCHRAMDGQLCFQHWRFSVGYGEIRS